MNEPYFGDQTPIMSTMVVLLIITRIALWAFWSKKGLMERYQYLKRKCVASEMVVTLLNLSPHEPELIWHFGK